MAVLVDHCDSRQECDVCLMLQQQNSWHWRRTGDILAKQRFTDMHSLPSMRIIWDRYIIQTAVTCGYLQCNAATLRGVGRGPYLGVLSADDRTYIYSAASEPADSAAETAVEQLEVRMQKM